MSDQKELPKMCAAKLRAMAAELEDADELTPDEVTCHRDLGPRINQAERRLRALAAELERR